jgi:hypothetical protein
MVLRLIWLPSAKLVVVAKARVRAEVDRFVPTPDLLRLTEPDSLTFVVTRVTPPSVRTSPWSNGPVASKKH